MTCDATCRRSRKRRSPPRFVFDARIVDCVGARLQSLRGLDAGFLYLEAAGTPMHVGSLMLIELTKRRGYDFHGALLAHLAERLPRAPALRRRDWARTATLASVGQFAKLRRGLADAIADAMRELRDRLPA
jgi:hypothetical protein